MKQPDNPPAFPIPDERDANGCGIVQGSSGMSLRDYFAAAALQGLTAGRTPDDIRDFGHAVRDFGHAVRGGNPIAMAAYTLADAMLKARESRHD